MLAAVTALKKLNPKTIGYIVLASVFISGAIVGWLGYKHIQSQNEIIINLRVEISEEKAKVTALNTAIKATNTALAQFAVIDSSNDSQFQLLDQRLKARDAKLVAELNKLAKDPVPQTCSEAIQYLRDINGDSK